MKPLSLKILADTLDAMMDEWQYYLNKDTGEIIEIQTEYLAVAEDTAEDDSLDEFDSWEKDCIQEARDIVENWESYIRLPECDEINEYQIMLNFSESIAAENLRKNLSRALEGRGAFRRFKDTIQRYNLEQKWYSFKYDAVYEIAKDWCDMNGIEYLIDSK